MSEYQYYEFRSIDRPLTRQEMDELRGYSTRAEINAHSFVNEYSYGSFRGKPDEFMLKYFDAHLYVANWGTHTLMFRLPRRLVDVSIFQPYFETEQNKLTVTEDYVVVKFTSVLEGGEGWINGESMIDDLLPLREELLAGDLRCLYVAWLSDVTGDFSRVDDPTAVFEPPVPPGLKTLSPALKELANFLRVDVDLLTAAAERSPTGEVGTPSTSKDLSAWLGRQTAKRKDSWLLELLTEEGIGARREILRELQKTQRAPDAAAAGKPRTLAELQKRAEAHEAERKAAATTAARAEKRRAEAERARHLDSLVGQEEQMWKKAEAAIETKKAAGYAEAILFLVDLRDLAERKGRLTEVKARLGELRVRHKAKTAFLRKLKEAGLVD